jgi:hypothetical protein
MEEVPAIKKNLLLKKKVHAAETKERTKDKREREREKLVLVLLF